jgi:hypothetical protein
MSKAGSSQAARSQPVERRRRSIEKASETFSSIRAGSTKHPINGSVNFGSLELK